MNVIVDTCIWSETFRKKTAPENEKIRGELRELISEQRVILLGPVRQEILAGLPDHKNYLRLRDLLRAFDHEALGSTDYELAAHLSSVLRSKGIQGSNTDFLICAAAQERHAAIFTTDKDFLLYAVHIDLHLHQAR